MGKRFEHFQNDDQGTATIETVLWLPVFIAFFCLIADASFVFFGQNKTYRIVQDANRKLSIGRFETAAEVEVFLLASLTQYAPNAQVYSDIAAGTVTTQVSIPASDLVATGLVTSIADANITVQASHFVEY